ncbi:protein of unknown function [Xenorhabdus doucetiae]|uniref:Uncharacterized protein n=1 Tax=Xenorhabdus doucetiae TaxID=351671 RepID=A0A068QMV1_9GAMM|nr:protein of unknown function [Xenorhabdus doucetiae]
MLHQSTGYIGRYSGIQAPVPGSDQVDIPVRDFNIHYLFLIILLS